MLILRGKPRHQLFRVQEGQHQFTAQETERRESVVLRLRPVLPLHPTPRSALPSLAL